MSQFDEELRGMNEAAAQEQINIFLTLIQELKTINENQSFNPARRKKEITRLIETTIRRKPELAPLQPELHQLMENVCQEQRQDEHAVMAKGAPEEYKKK